MPPLGYEKSRQALTFLPKNSLWLFLTREGSDPASQLIFDTSVSGNAAFMLHPEHGVMALVANYDKGHVERLDTFTDIRAYERSMETELKNWLKTLNPDTIYLNYSETDHLSDGLTHGQFLRAKRIINETLPNASIDSSERMLGSIRGQKTPEEINRLKVAIEGSGELYARLLPRLKVGQSEREIQSIMLEIAADLKLEPYLGDYGGPLVCINRVGLAHRAPGDDRVEPGDLLILDHGLAYKKYYSDIARTIYFKRDDETTAPDKVLHAFQSAYDAITAAFEAVKPGIEGWVVDAAARNVHLNNGYPEISHATGHQIGRHVHDGGAMFGPKWERYGNAPFIPLEVGNVITIEPTILQSPEPSMLVEENIVITTEGAQWLSKRQDKLWVV